MPAALLLGSLLLASPAYGQGSSKSKAITVEPILQEIVLETSDASKKFTVQITNNTPATFNFSLEALDFRSLDETGGIFFTGSEAVNKNQKYGLANWLELDKKTVSLPAGKKVKINVTLFNRLDLSPGGHYGAIFINSAGNRQDSDKSIVTFKQSISSLVLAIKRGGEKYDLKLDAVSTNGDWLNKPEKVTLRFKNTGNTHVVPRGVVSIKDNQSEILQRGVINESSGYILPESYRQFPVGLKQVNKFPLKLVNSYKVTVDYRYDGLERFATKTITVRWINWPLAIGSLAVLLFIAAAAYRTIKKS